MHAIKAMKTNFEGDAHHENKLKVTCHANKLEGHTCHKNYIEDNTHAVKANLNA